MRGTGNIVGDKNINENKNDNDVYEYIQEIRQEILPHGSELMRENRFQVFAAMKQMLRVARIAFTEGLDPLLREGERLAESDSYLDRFLSLELNETSLAFASVSAMLREYASFHGDLSDRFIMYIYIRGMMMLMAGVSPNAIEAIYGSMLPLEERGTLKRYLHLEQTKSGQ